MAVESQKIAKEEKAPAAASSPVDALGLKDIQVPDFKAPDIKVPDFKAPSFSMPKVDIPDMPKVDIPAPPKVDIPATPKAAAPSFSLPADFPKVDMPKVDMPKMDMPSFSMPKVDMPKVDMPAAPKFDTPKFDMPSAPSSSSSSSSYEFDGPSQEVRDARAAELNAAYKDAKSDAKVSPGCFLSLGRVSSVSFNSKLFSYTILSSNQQEAQKAADAAMKKANEAKKVFKQAKGEACATRPGGKA